jgi:hypothetical protein
MKKEYLGDSVYAEIEDGMLLLTTDNGYGPNNKIFLEQEVIEALLEYVARLEAVSKWKLT